MTRAQLKQAGKLMRNVCQPKNKVTNGKNIIYLLLNIKWFKLNCE